ncbi:MAG: Rnase Y domain-containing protein, partial [Candidatus Uhrbacteria bacterium]
MSEAFLLPILSGLAILGAGIALGYMYRHLIAARRIGTAEQKAEAIMAEAKRREREFLLKAKDKGLQIIDEAKQESKERRKELQQLQSRLEKREALFDKKLLEFEEKQTKLEERKQKLEEIKQRLEQLSIEQEKKLSEVANLSRDEAVERLLASVEESAHEALMSRIRKFDMETSDEIDRRAAEMLSTAIQRCASSHAVETTTTSVALPSDEMKGRIIGKEGRNIKTIEQLTGCEIIVDET